jgi:hypothetical protein
MKETLTSANLASETYTPAGSCDIKISGSWTGRVWLESQTSGEATWEKVPNSMAEYSTQYHLLVSDLTIVYRFNSNIRAGSAVCYIGS